MQVKIPDIKIPKIPKMPQKYIVIIVVVLLVLLGVYLWGRNSKKNDDEKQNDKEIRKGDLSYPLSQYNTFADRLEMAMFRLNDKESEVYAVFSEIHTTSDVLQLINAFGRRRIINTIGNSGLTTWLYKKLNGDEIQEVNSILTSNNISYQF